MEGLAELGAPAVVVWGLAGLGILARQITDAVVKIKQTRNGGTPTEKLGNAIAELGRGIEALAESFPEVREAVDQCRATVQAVDGRTLRNRDLLTAINKTTGSIHDATTRLEVAVASRAAQ